MVANFGASLAVSPIHALKPSDSVDGVDPVSAGIEHAVQLKKLPLLVAGDVVELERDEQLGSCRIVAMSERRSVLQRSDGPRGMKALAANLTHLAIVSAAPPGIDTLLIDQFCLAAHRAGIDAIIVINKVDLLNEQAKAEAEAILAVYKAIDYDTAMVNAVSEGGIETLRTALTGRAVTFVGASGVGKSSIIGALLPDLEVRTGAISAATGLGSHTTTVTCWYEFEPVDPAKSSQRPDEERSSAEVEALSGANVSARFEHAPISAGALIDSPGVRQYSVAHLQPADVRAGYRDIRDAAQACRFANCAHRVEPGCHVQTLVDSGEIARWRYKNYCKLLDSEE